uniref:Uncharacterized protein n=1 Tax=Moniliophthora roreri TaxID=221103 RepID=A0A0W0EY45_MONRR
MPYRTQGTSNVTQQINPYPMYPRPPSQIVPPTVPYINTVPSMQQPYQSGAQLLPPSLSHSRSHPTAPQNYTYQQQTAAGWMPPPHPGHDPASLGWTHAQRQQTPSPSYPSQMASYNPNYPVPHYQQPGDHTTLGRYYDPNRQDFDASHTMQNRRQALLACRISCGTEPELAMSNLSSVSRLIAEPSAARSMSVSQQGMMIF